MGALPGHGFQRFEWVNDFLAHGDKLARSSAPHYRCDDSSQSMTEESIQFLKENGIKHVISLNTYAEEPAIAKSLADNNIRYTPLPTFDFEPISLGHVLQGVEAFILNPTEPTLVWCGFGHGRTGTLISAIQMHRLWECSFPKTALQLDEKRLKENFVETAGQRHALNIYQYILDSKDSMTRDMRLLTGDYFLAFKSAVRRARKETHATYVLELLEPQTKFTPVIELAGDLAFAIEILQRFSSLTYSIMSSLKMPIPRPSPRDMGMINKASNMNELTNHLFQVLQEISFMRAFMAFFQEYAAPVPILQKLHDRMADFIEAEHDVVLRTSQAIQNGLARNYFEHLEQEKIRKGEAAQSPPSQSPESVSEEELLYGFAAEEAAQLAAKMPGVTRFSPEKSFLERTPELDEEEPHLETASAKAKAGRKENAKTAREKIALEEKVYGTDPKNNPLMVFLGPEAWDSKLSIGTAKTKVPAAVTDEIKESPSVGRLDAVGEFEHQNKEKQEQTISTERTDVTDSGGSRLLSTSDKSNERHEETSEEYRTPSEGDSSADGLFEEMPSENTMSSEATSLEEVESLPEEVSFEEDKPLLEAMDQDEETPDGYSTPEGELVSDYLTEQMGQGEQTTKDEAVASTAEVLVGESLVRESDVKDEAVTSTPEVQVGKSLVHESNVKEQPATSIPDIRVKQPSVDESNEAEIAFTSTDDWANAVGVFLASVGSVTGARILAHMAVNRGGQMSSPGSPVRLPSKASSLGVSRESLGVSQESLESLSDSLPVSIDVDPEETLALVQQVMEETVLEAVNNIPCPPMGPVEDRGRSMRLRESLKKGQMRSIPPLAHSSWLVKRTMDGEETAEQRAWKVKRLGPVIKRTVLRTLIRMLDKYDL
ncbi:hypothetical protein L249_1268 [Ophiocordyceps polyrhachis-furcata BCC 54312]|uniref:Swiss Army Knife protein DSP-PTPase phosphatase domain-containing protein n=1 Tax=Ophiocordyceps polyrhachis-furcata BCC 54312 TaxID=1330021 RepID=A0A367LCB5_9HYPO|nr:hypothetical protein L249_1268 [Ophiocordyceps polyrhachis-furcata BCC 54312]